MWLTITSMRTQSIQWQRDMVKDDGSCRHRFIRRLNWNVLSVDEIEQIKIKSIRNQTNTKENKRDTVVSRGSQT